MIPISSKSAFSFKREKTVCLQLLAQVSLQTIYGPSDVIQRNHLPELNLLDSILFLYRHRNFETKVPVVSDIIMFQTQRDYKLKKVDMPETVGTKRLKNLRACARVNLVFSICFYVNAAAIDERKIKMAIFENISKKVSRTSQGAIKRTKAMAETAKINAQISAENKVIWDNYTALGQRYYELFGGAPDEDLAEYIEAIRVATMKIDQYGSQISKLKGIERCPGCGAEMKDGAIYCTVCGTKLPEPAAEEMPENKICKNCGQPLGDDAVFCSGCGTRAE